MRIGESLDPNGPESLRWEPNKSYAIDGVEDY